ncbi:MAG: SHOCT-like domain-containing protein, partial [Fervidobacterium pennivorans]
MDKAELRQVLEAVERGEISPEDAEKLIEAIYNKE